MSLSCIECKKSFETENKFEKHFISIEEKKCKQIKNLYFIFQYDLDGNILDICKIGKTKHSPESRKDSLQVGNAHKLQVYKYLKTPYVDKWEKFFHDKYEEFHINGEWYFLTTTQVDRIYKKFKELVEKPPIQKVTKITIKKTINNVVNSNNNNVVNNVTQTKPSEDKKQNTQKDDNPFKCHRCDTIFTSQARLLNHLKNGSNNPCDFVCHDCGHKMESYMSFKRHRESKCTYFPKKINHKK